MSHAATAPAIDEWRARLLGPSGLADRRSGRAGIRADPARLLATVAAVRVASGDLATRRRRPCPRAGPRWLPAPTRRLPPGRRRARSGGHAVPAGPAQSFGRADDAGRVGRRPARLDRSHPVRAAMARLRPGRRGAGRRRARDAARVRPRLAPGARTPGAGSGGPHRHALCGLAGGAPDNSAPRLSAGHLHLGCRLAGPERLGRGRLPGTAAGCCLCARGTHGAAPGPARARRGQRSQPRPARPHHPPAGAGRGRRGECRRRQRRRRDRLRRPRGTGVGPADRRAPLRRPAALVAGDGRGTALAHRPTRAADDRCRQWPGADGSRDRGSGRATVAVADAVDPLQWRVGHAGWWSTRGTRIARPGSCWRCWPVWCWPVSVWR